MNFLIYNNQIAGFTDSIQSLPSGFECVEGPDLPIEFLYFDGEQIKIKGSPPSPEHFWNSEKYTWEIPKSPNEIVPAKINSLDWDMLISLLFNSAEWARAYSASEKTLKANTAFTLLLNTLTTLRRVETLEFALAKLREAMSNIAGVGDFTAEEIASINQKLATAGFDLVLS